jgi:hypothetical protein
MPQAPFTSTDPCICVQLKLLFPGPMSFHAALFYVYSCMALCVALVLTSWPRGLSHSLSLSCSHSHAVQFLIDTPCTWVQAPITLTAPPDLARRPLKHSRSHALAWLASAVPVPVGPSGVPGLAVPVPMGSLRGPWLAPAVPVPVGPSGVPGLAVPVPMGSLRGPWPRLCQCQRGPQGSLARLCRCRWGPLGVPGWPRLCQCQRGPQGSLAWLCRCRWGPPGVPGWPRLCQCQWGPQGSLAWLCRCRWGPPGVPGWPRLCQCQWGPQGSLAWLCRCRWGP